MKIRIAAFLTTIVGLTAAAVPSALASTAWDLRVSGSVAKIVTLPVGTIGAKSTQTGTLTISVKTDWVDSRATVDSPNIIQAGLSSDASQWKLQIAHKSSNPHQAQCRVKGLAGGVIRADGPDIDVANGQWHTIVCVKSPDSGSSTKVQVFVDGVAGKAYTVSRIGDVLPTRQPTAGGRSTVSDSDSLDGWADGFSMVTS
ncbi:MAG: hypothetical protein WAN48_08950 [Actinomycetes bacterium]